MKLENSCFSLINVFWFSPGLKVGCDYELWITPRARAHGMAFTHPHPAPSLGLWPETGFCSSGLPSHCSNDAWKRFKRREEGGREEASPDSLPSLPLLSKHGIFAMSAVGGKAPPAGAQGWMCVWAGIAPRCSQPQAHDPYCALLCFPSSCCPQQDTTQRHLTGVPTPPGPPVCPKLALKHQWLSSCKDNCGDPAFLHLIPPWCIGTPGRRRTQNAHAHTHKTNPKSGSVSERIN